MVSLELPAPTGGPPCDHRGSVICNLPEVWPDFHVMEGLPLPEPAGSALESSSQTVGISDWQRRFIHKPSGACSRSAARLCAGVLTTVFKTTPDVRVCLRTCPCRSECPGRAWLSQPAESSDCGWYRWTGCCSERRKIWSVRKRFALRFRVKTKHVDAFQGGEVFVEQFCANLPIWKD